MSADNGIYILCTARTPVKTGDVYINQHNQYEWRVAHCQAIENIDESDLYLPILFGDSEIFLTQDAANEYAIELGKQYEFLEYGICYINKDTKYFPNMTKETALKAVDCYQGSIPV